MKIYLEASHLSADKSRQHLKIDEVQYLLDRHENIQKRRFLKTLAEVVVFPDSFLSSLPAALLAKLIIRFYDFLEGRAERIDLQVLPLLNGDQHLLLINAPNAPYLVETLLLLQQKYHTLFSLIAHPALTIKRRNQGIIYLENQVEGECGELFILIRLDNIDNSALPVIQAECRTLLTQVYRAFQASSAFTEQLENIKTLNGISAYQPLVSWLQHDVFIPLWYRPIKDISGFAFKREETEDVGIDFPACLNIFNAGAAQLLSEEIRRLLASNSEAVVHKLAIQSPLISNQPLIYIGLREKHKQTETEHAFIGLIRNIELNHSAYHIAPLQEKIEQTLARIRVTQGSHDYVKLREIFSLFPKLELFFLREEQLYLLGQSLCRYLNRPDALKLLFLASPSPLRLSFLVIIPQEFLTESLSSTVVNIICDALGCQADDVRMINYGESYSALYLSLGPRQQQQLHIDIARLEKRLNRNCRPWPVQLRRLLDRAFGKTDGGKLWCQYHDSFAADYQAMLPPRYAVKDIVQIEKAGANGGLGINLLTPCHGLEHFRLHFHSTSEQYLDEYIPVLDNLNLRLIDQVQFTVKVQETTLFIKSFTVMPACSPWRPLQKLKPLLLGVIEAMLKGKVENDRLNQLVLLTGMSWQDVDVLRTYRNYCLQLGFHVTLSSFHRALLNNPQLVRLLYQYFEVRFSPDA
nr:NAD-glutamate dehydrogenase domain-containing protein [Methylomarinum sp. Ch1-1]MDP4522111.1 NAD-glutamate dehydrogenase [Methylomarinum sp. Ch1-1]